MDYNKAKEKLLEYVKGARYEHCLGVARLSARLAKAHGLDEDRARMAGLLHDSAKQLSEEQFQDLVRAGEIACDAETLDTPRLHHAPFGAWLAKHEFGVKDPEILEAIAAHPTGAPGLSPLGLALFIADYCEESRDLGGLNGLRKKAEKDLVEAALAVCEAKMKYLMKKRRRIHSKAVAFWNDLAGRSGGEMREKTTGGERGENLNNSVT